MEPFINHSGRVAVLMRENIDTDQIIPKEHLKSIKRTGFGPALFSNWRYDAAGKPLPDFVLNQKNDEDASILIAGNNFGCGSSREHAVWAIQQFGFCVVIAPTKGEGSSSIPAFADIFRSNSFKNGLLTIELSPSDVEEIIAAHTKAPQMPMTIDLQTQTLALGELEKSFHIDEANRQRLLKGLDEIGLTLLHEKEITAYEKNRAF